MNKISKNLVLIIRKIGLSQSEFARNCGVSYNTLSNIINGNFNPSEDTIEKIILYIHKKGFEKDDLFRETKMVSNVRVTTNAPLSGNEKSILNNSFHFVEEKFSVAFDLEYKNPYSEIENISTFLFFDIYTGVYKNDTDFTTDLRLAEFLKKIQNLTTLDERLNFFLKPTNDTKKLIGLPYYSMNITNTVKPDILEIVLSLGIKIGFESLGSKKIDSFSTSLVYDAGSIIEQIITYPPCIIINKDCCKTFEQFKYLVAKEFYFMISNEYSSEYKTLDIKNILLKKESVDADRFATEIILPNDRLKDSWSALDKSMSYCDRVTCLKNYFKVSYQLVIERINKIGLIKDKYTGEQYLEDLKRYCVMNDIKYEQINGEPFPYHINYFDNDYFDTIFIAAYKLNKITESEVCKFLSCSPDELSYKGVSYIIDEIVNDVKK